MRSATGEWYTPQWLYDQLAWEVGGFDLALAAGQQQRQGPLYITSIEDGLAQPWIGKVFLNPTFLRLTPESPVLK